MLDPQLTNRRWLRELSGSVRGWLGLAGAAGILAGLCTIVQMGLLAWLVDQLVTHASAPAALGWAFFGLIGVLVLRAVAQWVQERASAEASLRIRARVRGELLEHLAALGPVRLGDRHSAGLGQQLVEQVEALDGYFARFLPQMRLTTVLPLVILAVVASLDWLAAALLLLAAPLIPLFMALVGMGAERLNREQFVAVTRLAGHFLDRVRGVTTLQLFNRTADSINEVHAAADDYRRRSLRTLRLAFLSSAVLEFFASVAIAMVAIYIGFGLLGYIAYGPADALTLFSGLFVLLLAPEFFQPLRTLSQHYHDRAAALGAADGLLALLKEPLPQGHRAGASRAEPGHVGNDHVGIGYAADGHGASIALRGVTIAHPGRGRVLGPLDLEIAAGECVALIGPSGSGKSSLLQLLAGFIEADSGTLTIGASGRIAWMDQRPWLIQGTLADNLRLAAPRASDAELWAALRRAGLGELVGGLPEGLATPLGERGYGFSGGQAQRLALARVFLARASLVLLDEPTASLDSETQGGVVDGLRELMASGATVVVATHQQALMSMAGRRIELSHQARRQEIGHDASA
ncbi:MULTISPECIES: thiol reductant ABC exporter subunit CydD [Halomonadaceae]|uniref:Thiol reductant ABC exporter subunit CydD n=1 Tax=Modicisalibacter zincidurans TaxID=1178777 RepID=A0ABP9RCE6_9GAMM|nr:MULTISPECIES: thiol reductant ABC exporter subunit CydD [Halomonas]MCD6008406.1 thiol reductant ABC exporter subunit CydD [Halomonas sp. IOP_31]